MNSHKYSIVFLIFLFALLWVTVSFWALVKASYGFDVSLTPQYNIYVSEKLEAAPGLAIRAGSSIYAWGSYERTLLRFGGQESVNVTLGGLGIGARKTFDNLSLWIEAGYYEPLRIETRGESFQEGVGIEINQVVAPYSHDWSFYEYELKGAFGGSIGGAFNYPLSEACSMGLTASYRYLRLGEWLIGHDGSYDESVCHWEVYQERDFSAWQTGLSITYRF